MSGSFGGPQPVYLLDTPKIVYWTSNLRGQKCALKRRVLERNGVLSTVLFEKPPFSLHTCNDQDGPVRNAGMIFTILFQATSSLASAASGKHCGIEAVVHISIFCNRIQCEKIVILMLHCTLR
jgi:hypothetical protein